MARNDRRGDDERGGIGTMTRSRPGQDPRSRQDQVQAAADVAAPAPRRGRQARGVPPQRAFDGQQATPVRRPPAEPHPADQRIADPRTGDRRGEGRTARRPAPGQSGADPRRGGWRGRRQPGADPRRADQPGNDPRTVDPRRAEQPGTDPRRTDPRSADPRRTDRRSADPRRADRRSADALSADPRRADPRARAPRNAAVFERQGAPARTVPRPAGQPDQVPPSAPQPPQSAPQAASQASAVQSLVGSHRMPFVLLLCGLLGGALVSALVISTTLAAGSFEITRLQDSTSALAKQRQALEQQVAQAKSPEVIAERASKLGMQPAGLIQFIDLKTGKTLDDHNIGYLAHVHYPGYTP